MTMMVTSLEHIVLWNNFNIHIQIVYHRLVHLLRMYVIWEVEKFIHYSTIIFALKQSCMVPVP